MIIIFVQACRVLSLENGTVVKQGVSPRGLCQGNTVLVDNYDEDDIWPTSIFPPVIIPPGGNMSL